MFDDGKDGVVIGDGRSRVRLSRAGDANELGYPTLIEVRAGTFSGAVNDDGVYDYAKFVEQLNAPYGHLSGVAELSSYEGFRLSATGRAESGSRRSLLASIFPLSN